jgi:hypothetical protein
MVPPYAGYMPKPSAQSLELGEGHDAELAAEVMESAAYLSGYAVCRTGASVRDISPILI